MPFEITLPLSLKRAGWKVKIFDKERLEPPHVTLLRGVQKWRVNLRDGRFLVPPGGSWKDVPPEVRVAVEAAWTELSKAWDAKYPENPVESADDE